MSEEKIEVFSYRKDNITDYSQISLQKSFVTREELADSLKANAAVGKEFAVFEKSNTAPDLWLVLLKCYDDMQNRDTKIQHLKISLLENISSAIDDVIEDL